MKKSTSYFGNRFSTALRGIRSRRRSSQISIAPAAPVAAPAEFEALEARILLSGLTDGTRVLKNFSFTDADGDRVSIKVTGQLARGAGFQVTDLGNGYDVDEINLVGLTSKNSLAITVTPTRLSNSAQTNTGGFLWSPGYTNIGSIVSDAQTTNTGAATAVSAGLRNLGISAAVVADINLPATDIVGSIVLATGKTGWVDRINTVSAANNGANAEGYNPVAGLIDLGDVTAQSIGRITVNGIISSPTNNGFGTDTNDIDGTITVSGNLGGIIGLRSILNGDVNVGGNLGKIQVAQFNGNINVGGNLTIVLPSGSSGTVIAGGHVNLGFGAGGGNWSNVTAGAGISGIQASLTDTINVPSAYTNTLSNLSTANTAGSGIANIQVTGSDAAAFALVSGNSIGNISAGELGSKVSVTAGAGGIGNVATTAGELAGTYISGGNIGNLSANSATNGITGTFNATGDIGNILATSLNGDAISGTFTAGNSIGTITAGSTVGGDAINGATFTANLGNIGGIVANATGTFSGNDAISSAIFTAAGNIGSINATSSAGDALANVTVTADSDQSNVGNIGAITATTASTFGGVAIINGTYTGVTIGNITAKATSLTGPSDAINGAIFIGVTNTETAVGSGKFNNFGTINTITVSNASTNAAADGIVGATFVAGSAGSIGNISATTAGGDAIGNSDFLANGTTGSDTIFDSIIGTVTVSKAGAVGIIGSDFAAQAGIGAISVTSVGTGITGATFSGNFNSDGTGDIGAITVVTSGVNANGIAGASNFTAANIGNVQVTLGATAGTGDAINGSIFQAVTNTETAAGSKLFNNFGEIGSITVTNASTNAAAEGIVGAIFVAGSAGSIDNISATTAGGNAIDSSNFLANGTTGSDTIFDSIIGTVTVSKAGAVGIIGSDFAAQAGIGAISVTSVGTGIAVADFFGDSNADGTGNIGAITVVTSGVDANGIAGASTFTAANIGNVQVTLGATTGTGDAINGSIFQAATNTETAAGSKLFNNFGEIGSITVTNASINAVADGIVGATFIAGSAGSIGNISATTAGGDAIGNSDFLANGTTGSDTIFDSIIGTVTVSKAGAVGIIGSDFAAQAGIGAISVTSVGTGITGATFSGDFNSDGTGNIGAISAAVSTAAANAIDTTVLSAASIVSVTVTGTNLGIATLTATGTTSVGAITSSGTASQSVALNAPSIGDVTFNSMALSTTATISVGAAATSLGAVTVDAPTAPDTAGLILTGGSAGLVSVGNITVDGNANISGVTLGAEAAVGDITVGGTLTTLGALSTAKSIGALTVDTLAVPSAVIAIGAGTLGGSIGLITIGNDLANAGAFKYNFTFETYIGAPDDVIISSPAPVQLLNASAAPGTTSTLGGLTFIEV